MSDNNKMTPEERRRYNRAETKAKFGRWWLVYVALAFTGILSFSSGVMLPFQPDESGFATVTLGGILAAVYYSAGFLATGEGAFYFWFDKLTDHDPDNTPQIILAWLMLVASVVTSLVTALAAAGFIAFWLNIFSAFEIMPLWGQKWVVWAIPAFVVAHLVTGTIFRAVSVESEYERDSKADVRNVKNQIAKDKNFAYAQYWKQNAASLAQKLGELEAQEEIANYSRKIQVKQRQVRASFAAENEKPELSRERAEIDPNAQRGEQR